MKISFSESDLKQLTQIAQGVTDGKEMEELIDICQGISLSVPNQEFPLVYAGVLLARNNQVHHAIKVLRLCQSSVFGKTLAEYLSETQHFSKQVKTFANAKPYDAWMQSEMYQSIRAGVLEAVKHFSKENPPHSVDEPTIIDIGPGNGTLIVEIVKQLPRIFHKKAMPHLMYVYITIF